MSEDPRRGMTAIRWINDACYEIRLPDGREVLIDPYIDESPNHVLHMDAEGADYVLISHTHFDHVLSLGTIVERFEPQIFVGKGSMLDLVEAFRLPGHRITGCVPGDIFEFDDLRIEALRGKHTKLGPRDTPDGWRAIEEANGISSAFHRTDVNGSYEYTNYLLTLQDNLCVLVWGGTPDYDNAARMARLRPNVSIVQFTGNALNPLERVADFCVAVGGPLVFPHHHDRLSHEMAEGSHELVDIVDDIERRSFHTRVVLPEKGVWYRLSMGCDRL